MKIKKVVFSSIRNFNYNVEFDFSENTAITTISGKNGSGKTTIFKCLALCQKAFFIHQLKNEEAASYIVELNQSFAKYFLKKGAFIEVVFFTKYEIGFEHSFSIHCTEHSAESVSWELRCSQEAGLELKRFWNFDNPSEIIVFVDSDKHFNEENISHENISVSLNSPNQLIIQTILNPEKLFTNIYGNLINDYLKERLVPAKPRRDIYFLPTKIFTAALLPQVTLANFSGQEYQGQFVLLAKTSSSSTHLFDIRNFSSGEKTLLYILLFINYVQRIGLLVIDEPENHFHEDLLVRFIDLLREVCIAENHVSVIQKVAKRIGFALNKQNIKDVTKYYHGYNLSQVILLTHSKNVIYNNFLFGNNFYLDNGLKKIEYESFEKTLREIGLSSVYSKVLFVEGATETEYFDLFFNEHNIKVHSLSGCGAVIDVYNRILQIKRYLKDYHFCFLIDRDTRDSNSLSKIRDKEQHFFDEHFIVLDRHEFENYLLEPDIFLSIIDKYSDKFDDDKKLTLYEIELKLKQFATEEKDHVIRKTLNNKNQESLNKLRSKIVNKSIPIRTFLEYTSHVDSILQDTNFKDILTQDLLENYNQTNELLKEEIWNTSWKSLCDGKIVLGKAVTYFSQYLEIKSTRLQKEIRLYVFNPKSHLQIKDIITRILAKFKTIAPVTKGTETVA